jgi:hypothetical protein
LGFLFISKIINNKAILEWHWQTAPFLAVCGLAKNIPEVTGVEAYLSLLSPCQYHNFYESFILSVFHQQSCMTVLISRVEQAILLQVLIFGL